MKVNMKVQLSFRSVSIVLVLLSTILAACGGATPTSAPPEPTAAKAEPTAVPPEATAEEVTTLSGTVVVWTFPMTADDAPMYNELDEAFSKEYPNITVQREIWPWEARNEKMTISTLPLGEAPDVVYLNTDILALLMQENALEPLEQYLPQERIEDFYPVWTNLVSSGGHFYNAPILANNWTYLYNKTIFEEAGLDPNKPPTTWEEVTQACEKVTKPGEIWCIFLPADSIHTMVNMFVHLVAQAGGEVLDPYPAGNTVTLNSESAVKALTWWTDLYKNGYIPEAALSGSMMLGSINVTGNDLWNRGELAISPHLGAGALNDIKNSVAGSFEYGVVPPLRMSVDFEPVDFGSIGGYSMFAKSENKDAAGAWVEFMTRPENLHIFLEHTGFVPPSESTMNMVTTQDPIWLEFAGYSKYSHESILHPRSTELNTVMIPLLQATLLGEMTPQEALDEGARLWKDIIARP